MFYSTMLLPIAERQEMCLVACELLSLVSGLFLTIPISFMDFRTMKDAPKGFTFGPITRTVCRCAASPSS